MDKVKKKYLYIPISILVVALISFAVIHIYHTQAATDFEVESVQADTKAFLKERADVLAGQRQPRDTISIFFQPQDIRGEYELRDDIKKYHDNLAYSRIAYANPLIRLEMKDVRAMEEGLVEVTAIEHVEMIEETTGAVRKFDNEHTFVYTKIQDGWCLSEDRITKDYGFVMVNDIEKHIVD